MKKSNGGDNMNQCDNEFVTPVFQKKKKIHLKSYKLLKNTLKKMDKISPDFNTMYKIWEAVDIFHDCFMHSYNDTSTLHLFLATVPKGQKNMYAMIYREANFSIKYLLQLKDNDKIINIEIDRNTSNKSNTPERISFNDGEYEITSEVEEQKFIFIISCLMNGIKELIVYYYKNKRF